MNVSLKTELMQPDPDQPRKFFPEDEIRALGDNMNLRGQLVPVIVYGIGGGRYVIADGERRWRAAGLVGIPELMAVVLQEKPSAARLGLIQASIDIHRVSFNAMERSDLLTKIRAENNWSVTELATQMNMQQSAVSKLLMCQRLTPKLKDLLREGKLDAERAYLVASADADKQAELASNLTTMTRDQIRKSVKPAIEQPKAKRAVFALSGGKSISYHGPEATLAEVAEHLVTVAKELRRAESDGQDIKTQQSVMRNKAKEPAAVSGQ